MINFVCKLYIPKILLNRKQVLSMIAESSELLKLFPSLDALQGDILAFVIGSILWIDGYSNRAMIKKISRGSP